MVTVEQRLCTLESDAFQIRHRLDEAETTEPDINSIETRLTAVESGVSLLLQHFGITRPSIDE